MPSLTCSVVNPILNNSCPTPLVFSSLLNRANCLAPASVFPPKNLNASPLFFKTLLNCSIVRPAPDAALIMLVMLPLNVAPMLASLVYSPYTRSALSATAPKELAKNFPTRGILPSSREALDILSPTCDMPLAILAIVPPRSLIKLAARTTEPASNPTAPLALSILAPIEAAAFAPDAVALADVAVALAAAEVDLAAAFWALAFCIVAAAACLSTLDVPPPVPPLLLLSFDVFFCSPASLLILC